jgi:hypothetical protein
VVVWTKKDLAEVTDESIRVAITAALSKLKIEIPAWVAEPALKAAV